MAAARHVQCVHPVCGMVVTYHKRFKCPVCTEAAERPATSGAAELMHTRCVTIWCVHDFARDNRGAVLN